MGRGRHQKTQDLIDAARIILEEIEPATVRGVCYQLFNRKLIPDMSKNSTGRVSRLLVQAREGGEIPWEWIVDETRPVELVSSWSNPAQFIRTAIRSYRKDRWANQSARVMLVSEKGTVGGVIRPITEEYGIPFQVFHGFGSATAINDLAEQSMSSDRALVILYAGDYDPSGCYMSDHDLEQRLNRYGGYAEIERVAVTPAHIERYNLLTFSAEEKKTDARHGWFVERYGQTCCELDALNPNVLRTLVEQAIVARLDWEAWQLSGSTEASEEASVSAFLRSWPGMAS